jgi:hypothetical protein
LPDIIEINTKERDKDEERVFEEPGHEVLLGVEVFPQLIFRDVPTCLPEDRAQSACVKLTVSDDSQRLFFTTR